MADSQVSSGIIISITIPLSPTTRTLYNTLPHQQPPYTQVGPRKR